MRQRSLLSGNFMPAVLLFTWILPAHLHSAENYLSGSRFAGMANASVMIPDIWSVSHNQAGLAFLNNLTFSIHNENKFIVPQYGLNALALAIPTKPGTLGFSFYYFGYSKYHETKSGLSFSKLLGQKISFGVQLNYHSIYISEEFGRSSALSVEGGFLAQPVKGLFIGAHIFNPSQSGFQSPEGDESLPTIFRFGLGYRFLNMVQINLETEKQTDFKPIWKIGIELEAADHLYIRGGLASDPQFNTIGLGYEALGIRGDLAFSFHPQLGFTPHFSLSYTLP